MKKKIVYGVSGLLGFALAVLMWQFVIYSGSPQGRLDQIVSSGRTTFQLNEIIGGNWSAVCLLPPSNKYPEISTERVAGKRFLKWFEKSLGRPVSPVSDYGGLERIHNRMYIVTNNGNIGSVRVGPWQHIDERVWMVMCVRDPAMRITIDRFLKPKDGIDDYTLNGRFERYFVLSAGMEVNLDEVELP